MGSAKGSSKAKKGSTPAKRQKSRASAKAEESRITIAFAGLIYFRHKEGPKETGLFTACVLKGIPEHSFRLFGDITVNGIPKNKHWDLQVIPSGSTAALEGAHPRIKEGFDRKNKNHPSDDYQWIVDFDELHGRGNYKLDEQALGPVVRIPAGEFYTLCRTVRLGHRQGDDEMEEFGFMADITGVDIVLNQGDKLVLRSGSYDIIEPLEYDPTPRFIVFANLPPAHMLGTKAMKLRKTNDENDPPTHFLNYYLAIGMPYEERFDFPHLLETIQSCPLPEGLSKLLKKEVTKSPAPYYCGTGGGTG